MIPGSANPLLLASAEADAYEIERSLRFNSSDSAYLSRTPSTAGNRKTWTWAGWVKLWDYTTQCRVFSSNGINSFGWDPTGTLRFSIAGVGHFESTAVYRDPSAWYHLVVSCDTTKTTDFLIFYINGAESFRTNANFNQNSNTNINSTNTHFIGSNNASQLYSDFYLAEINFIDGQALDPSSFGEFDANGIWQPIEYTGTYGTNGFHLPFSDNSTAAALGTDTSGNGNDWTVNNISIGGVAVSLDYTGASNYLDQAIDGILGNSSATDVAYTATFTTPIAYNSLTVVYGNMANGALGNPASGAVLYVNGSGVSATGTYGTSPYTSTYYKHYTTNTPGTLSSLGISGNVRGSHQTGIYEVFVNGVLLQEITGAIAAAENDSLVDSPTNGDQTDTGVGGEVVGNYCTWNPLTLVNGGSLSNGNLDAVLAGGSSPDNCKGTILVSSGKWYYEITIGSGTYDERGSYGWITPELADSSTVRDGAVIFRGASATQQYYIDGSGTSYGVQVGTGDVIGCALDLDSNTTQWYINGSAQGSVSIPDRVYTPYLIQDTAATNTLATVVNFGQRPFAYAAPSGYKALCTANLPSTTITTSGSYTGNGVADGPFVYLNGVPTAMTVGGNAVTFGTDADKLSNGFKIRTTSTTYNQNASTYSYTITSTGDPFKTARAQSN